MKVIKLLIFALSLVAVKSPWAQITIMPLGDSITRGSQSTDLNGYRRDLRDFLVSSGYDVNFVGSLENGTFVDNQHEGHSGFETNQIKTAVYNYLTNNPAQIVLLHIGTNDISANPSYTDSTNVKDILDNIDLWETEKNRTAIVILAEIINREGHACPDESTTTQFNNNVKEMALGRTNDRIIIVDMECSAGLNYNTNMADTVHPNDNGYEKMAAIWFDGLLKVLPQADAGADQNVDENTYVTLDGSGSDDPNGTYLYYWWQQLSPGTTVTLSDPSNKKPTFRAPAVGSIGERLEFELTVTDTDGFEHSDTVFIDVGNVLLPPVVDAGPDQIVTEGSTVTLDGSNSHDPDGAISSVQWEQVPGGTQVTLTAPNDLITEFKAPEVDAAGETLTFKLTLRDNDDLVSSDIVTINVKSPEAPVADAGPDQSVTEGDVVTLNGSNSNDLDGTITLVQWEQVSGTTQVTLTAPTDLTTQFEAPEVDVEGVVLTFKLTITDNDGIHSENTVNVTVTPAVVSAASSNGGGSGGGGCFIQSVMN